MNHNQNTISLTVSSDPRYLKLVRSVILQAGMLMHFTEKTCRDITLAADEAMTNIIKHSYKNDYDRQIIVTITFHDRCLEIALRDFGEKADPSTIKPRDLSEIKPGGLGVFFIKKIMDDVEYDSSPEHGTILRLKKYVEPHTQHSTFKNEGDECTST